MAKTLDLYARDRKLSVELLKAMLDHARYEGYDEIAIFTYDGAIEGMEDLVTIVLKEPAVPVLDPDGGISYKKGKK